MRNSGATPWFFEILFKSDILRGWTFGRLAWEYGQNFLGYAYGRYVVEKTDMVRMFATLISPEKHYLGVTKPQGILIRGHLPTGLLIYAYTNGTF